MSFMDKNTKLCFYDIESSGLNVYEESILEISFTDFDTQQSILHIYVLPSNGKKITNSNIHKIDEKVLEEKNALRIDDALNLINETLKKEYGNKLIVLGAHNNFGFDQNLLESEYYRADLSPPKNILFFDSIPFIKKYFPDFKSYALSSCFKSIMGRDIKDSDELHTASYDTKCLTELVHRCFNILLNQYKLRVKLDDFVRYSVFDKRYLNQNIKLTGFRNSNYLERKGIKNIRSLLNIYRLSDCNTNTFEVNLKNMYKITFRYKNEIKRLGLYIDFLNKLF